MNTLSLIDILKIVSAVAIVVSMFVFISGLLAMFVLKYTIKHGLKNIDKPNDEFKSMNDFE